MGSLDLVRWIELHSITDNRGTLTVIEGGQTTPFDVKRVYFLHDLAAYRGGHAHRDTHQLIIALEGTFDLTLSDRGSARTYCFSPGPRALYFPPMLFITISNISPDAIVLVLASTHYDRSRSIRSWEEYINESNL
jgi:hypothetical protein